MSQAPKSCARVWPADLQTRVTTGTVKELVDALCASMDRKLHRMENNAVLSETTILEPRYKKLVFNDNRAVDKALQRITAAARSSQPTPLPRDQELPLVNGEAEEGEQKEQQASAVWRFFEVQEVQTHWAGGRRRLRFIHVLPRWRHGDWALRQHQPPLRETSPKTGTSHMNTDNRNMINSSKLKN